MNCQHNVPLDFCEECSYNKEQRLNYIEKNKQIICKHNDVKIDCKLCHYIYIF